LNPNKVVGDTLIPSNKRVNVKESVDSNSQNSFVCPFRVQRSCAIGPTIYPAPNPTGEEF